MENLDLYQSELKKILKGCDSCRAKMCNVCPNGKRKKILRARIKELSPTKETWLERLKNFFN